MQSVEKALAKGSSFLSKSRIERPRHETTILLTHAISVTRETIFLEGQRQLTDKEQKFNVSPIRRKHSNHNFYLNLLFAECCNRGQLRERVKIASTTT